MNTRTVIALGLATVLGTSMSGAYADYDRDHDRGRDFRYEHRDGRDMHRDYRHERYERERHEGYYRRDYVVERPVYVAPRVIYAEPMPSSVNIVLPITLP
jgi:hypothetical protein